MAAGGAGTGLTSSAVLLKTPNTGTIARRSMFCHSKPSTLSTGSRLSTSSIAPATHPNPTCRQESWSGYSEAPMPSIYGTRSRTFSKWRRGASWRHCLSNRASFVRRPPHPELLYESGTHCRVDTARLVVCHSSLEQEFNLLGVEEGSIMETLFKQSCLFCKIATS